MDKDYSIRKIMVCLDGSETAELILPLAAVQALRFDSKMVLFQAYIVPSLTTAEDIRAGAVIGPELLEKEEDKLRNEVLEYLEGKAGTLREKGLEVETVAWRGQAGNTIVDYSVRERIDLIALVTHGHTGLGRVVFGSVADYVLKESGIPILIIRPKKWRLSER